MDYRSIDEMIIAEPKVLGELTVNDLLDRAKDLTPQMAREHPDVIKEVVKILLRKLCDAAN